MPGIISTYISTYSISTESMQSYRIAIGPHQGRKVFTLQSLPPVEEPKASSSRVAKVAGFSLHAGVVAQAHQRDKLERLCRYIARPAVSEKRLSQAGQGPGGPFEGQADGVADGKQQHD